MSRSRSISPRNDRDSKFDRRKHDRNRRSLSKERKEMREPRDRDRERDRKIGKEFSRKRSRSPRDDRGDERRLSSSQRRRDRSKERKRDRRDRDDYRDRDRSRERKREREEKEKKPGAVPDFLLKKPALTEKDYEGKSKEEIEMMKLMGFGSFDTTKSKHVPGNDVSAVHLTQKRKYRQYMNRRGGFNKPLDNC